MSSTVPSLVSDAPAAVHHPTACPSWCADRQSPMRHDFGPSFTPHWGPAVTVAVGGEALLRSELFRLDEDAETGETELYISGETQVQLSRDEADLLIVQAQAFVDALRVQRRQMDAS